MNGVTGAIREQDDTRGSGTKYANRISTISVLMFPASPGKEYQLLLDPPQAADLTQLDKKDDSGSMREMGGNRRWDTDHVEGRFY